MFNVLDAGKKLDELERKIAAAEKVSEDDLLWAIRYCRSMHAGRTKPSKEAQREAIVMLLDEANRHDGLMKLTDRELVDLVTNTWYSQVSMLSKESTILEALLLRLERANGGPVTDEDLEMLEQLGDGGKSS